MPVKITLIGAGSVVFAKNLIGDILQFPELSDATICLMDIDPARLKVADIMARRMITALKVKATVISTRDQRAAVKGARYVICTIQVGGYKPGTVIDFEIPRKYGLLQTIGDTLGVGGVFRALRTIPVINSIAKDIAEVGAPDCLLLNYTNPMAMNCWAVDRAVGIPHVGLCHSVQGTSQQLASFARLPYEDVSYLVAGINHMAFFLKFDYKGQDAYPLLFRLIQDPKFDAEKVRMEMMRRTGYFVTESSEHQSEYVPYFIHHGKDVISRFDVPIDEYLRRCESIIATWQATERSLLGSDSGEIQVGPQSHEYGSFIIHSRETDTTRIIYGNVPNRGLITNLPEGCCVELPCVVDANGIQPTRIGDLPPQLASLCRSNINVQELTVEAALTGKREHIYQAVMMDPHTATVLTLDKIWAMCDELIAAHQKHGLLGEFKPVIPNTGRAWAGTGDRILAELAIDESHLETSSRKLPVEVVVTNPRPKPVSVSLGLRLVEKDGEPGATQTVRISVPAGKTVRKKAEVARPQRITGAVTIDLITASPDVLARGTEILPRKVFSIGGDKKAAFELTLAGFPAVKGSFRATAKEIIFDFAVDDSKPKPLMDAPWAGSCIQMFFSDLASTKIREMFLQPQPGKPKPRFVTREFKPVAGARATQKIAPNGYTTSVSIPRSALNIPSGKGGFLWDVIINLTALGDAHSGGITSLNNRMDSYAQTGHYARVQID